MVTTPLDEMGTPLYFIAENAADAGFETPPNPHGQSLRTWVRALAGASTRGLGFGGWGLGVGDGVAVGVEG